MLSFVRLLLRLLLISLLDSFCILLSKIYYCLRIILKILESLLLKLGCKFYLIYSSSSATSFK